MARQAVRRIPGSPSGPISTKKLVPTHERLHKRGGVDYEKPVREGNKCSSVHKMQQVIGTN